MICSFQFYNIKKQLGFYKIAVGIQLDILNGAVTDVRGTSKQVFADLSALDTLHHEVADWLIASGMPGSGL